MIFKHDQNRGYVSNSSTFTRLIHVTPHQYLPFVPGGIIQYHMDAQRGPTPNNMVHHGSTTCPCHSNILRMLQGENLPANIAQLRDCIAERGELGVSCRNVMASNSLFLSTCTASLNTWHKVIVKPYWSYDYATMRCTNKIPALNAESASAQVKMCFASTSFFCWDLCFLDGKTFWNVSHDTNTVYMYYSICVVSVVHNLKWDRFGI